MEISVVERIDDLPAAAWNALQGSGNPFMRHEFLAALEHHDAVGERFGWLPRHLIARDRGRLLGAAPMYLKYNSYGEFVFDWAWADAYERAGLVYYPKLVAAAPYSPVAGARLLLATEPAQDDIAAALTTAALEQARSLGVSSLHWLFTTESQTRHLASHGLLPRLGCQFHWRNGGYRDFDDYLSAFTADKRKKLRRERRRVQEQGIEIEVLDGRQVSDTQWEIWQQFYTDTFYRKSGMPTLSGGFFRELATTMPDSVVLVLARYGDRYVAGAFNLRDEEALYGRHWGCSDDFHSLHFEACYYQGLEYCITHGLQRFEPGAQGEHKISRGFLPTATHSAHWLAHEGFREIIASFLARERHGMEHYMGELTAHSPFKATEP
ncbi:MAG: N-acetyltransferase [Pseudomonadota bacterium]|nr:MAG: N-acetyltransferase [Pseudomonadota bacterium]